MSQVREVAKGRVWIGDSALKHGLVDHLGDLTDAVRFAKQHAGLSLVHLLRLSAHSLGLCLPWTTYAFKMHAFAG